MFNYYFCYRNIIFILLIFFLSITAIGMNKSALIVPPFNDFYFIMSPEHQILLLTVNLNNVYLFYFNETKLSIQLCNRFQFDEFVKIVYWDSSNQMIFINTEKCLFKVKEYKSLEKLMDIDSFEDYFTPPKILEIKNYSKHPFAFDGRRIIFNSSDNINILTRQYNQFSYLMRPVWGESGFKIDLNYENLFIYYFAENKYSLNMFQDNIESLSNFNPQNFHALDFYPLSLGQGFTIKFKVIPPFSDRLTFFPRLLIISNNPEKKIFQSIFHEKLFPLADLNQDGLVDILLIHSPFGLGARDELETLAISKKVMIRFTPFLANKDREDYLRFKTVSYEIDFELFFSRSFLAKIFPDELTSLIFIANNKLGIFSLAKQKSKLINFGKTSINVVHCIDVNKDGLFEIVVGDRSENKIYIYYF